MTSTTKMQKKKLQKSLQDYLPKIKKPSSHNPFPSKNRILSGCKYPKNRSFAIDRNVNDGKDVVNDDGGAVSLADVDRLLFEDFKSLYLKDNCDDSVEISRRGARKGQGEGECYTFNDVILFDSPRLIYPPLNLRESRHYFVSLGSSSSLMEEARRSLMASEDVSSSSTLLTTNTVATTVTSVVDPAPEDKSPQVEGRVKLPEDCIAVINKTQCLYCDVKRSMSHLNGAVDWEFMEELLFCYLDLNERESHKYINSAFVDMVITLRQESNNRITSRSQDVQSYSNNNRRFGRSTMKR